MPFSIAATTAASATINGAFSAGNAAEIALSTAHHKAATPQLLIK